MSVDREYRIRIKTVGDLSGARDVSGAMDKLDDSQKKAGRGAEESGTSLRALHMALRGVGEVSKAAEIGLAALSGIMMGSATFAVMALVQGLRLVIDHFAELKQKSLEAARATVEFWQDALRANVDARKAAADYAEALEKIWRLCRARHKRQNAECRKMPSGASRSVRTCG